MTEQKTLEKALLDISNASSSEYARNLAFGEVRFAIVESPYAGTDEEIEEHMEYLRQCFSDCFNRGEIPIASHKLYPDIEGCNDRIENERRFGIAAGFALGLQLPKDKTTVAVYCDNGVSGGMAAAIEFYKACGYYIRIRSLKEED